MYIHANFCEHFIFVQICEFRENQLREFSANWLKTWKISPLKFHGDIALLQGKYKCHATDSRTVPLI